MHSLYSGYNRSLRIVPISIFLFLVIYSCKTDPPIYKIHNLNADVISVFGHAGMGLAFKYPIDTYESIEPVLRIGADGSEMDIQMTKDSVLMIYHHHFIEEMTLCDPGIINDKLWSEIWGCHITSPFSSSIRLISFNELMDELTASGKNIRDYIYTFDCKLYTNAVDPTPFFNQYANAVLKAIDDYGLQNNILIESQDTDFLRIIQNKRSGLKLFIYPASFEDGIQIASEMNLFGITINTNNISADQIELAHDAGFRVTLWGIGTKQENTDAIQKSPDYIQTDKPIELLKVFQKYKGF